MSDQADWQDEFETEGKLAEQVEREVGPSRAGKPDHSLCGDALAGRFGLSKLLPPSSVDTTTNLMKLSRTTDLFSAKPKLLSINLGLTLDTTAVVTAPIDVFARIIWTTGQGRQQAEVDVPAAGTTATVAGADGLEVYMIRRGSANALEVRGIASVGRASSASAIAQRTVLTPVLPLVVDEIIPDWARNVYTLPTVFGALAAPAGRLQFFQFRGGAVIADIDAPVDGEPAPIPNSARFFRVLGVAGGFVRAVFGLSI